jgi:hypothetical protein
MSTWIVIVATGLGSYLFRLSMIVLFDRITMSPYLERGRRAAGRGRRGRHRRPGHRLAPGRDPGRHADPAGRDRPATDLNYIRTS